MKILLLFLFTCFNLTSQNIKDEVYKTARFLNYEELNIPTDSILNKYNLGNFTIPLNKTIYQVLLPNKDYWLCVKLPKLNEDYYFSLENSTLKSINLYLKENNQLILLQDYKLSNLYRHSSWKLRLYKEENVFFLQVQDKKRPRTKFKIQFDNEATFLKKIETDYLLIGGFVFSIVMLLLITLYVFYQKKNKTILWFFGHLLFLTLDFIRATGIISQIGIKQQVTVAYNLDQYFLLFSGTCFVMFFYSYYNYTKQTLFCKYIFLGTAIIPILMSLNLIVGDFIPLSNTPILYPEYCLIILASISALIHFYLAAKKQIPIYLTIGFAVPAINAALFFAISRSIKISNFWEYILENIVYTGALFELLMIVLFIVKESVEGELNGLKVAKEHSLLKLSFNEKLQENENIHRNMLVNNIHDSFSGHIEALRLNLLMKNKKNDEINHVLDAFTNDYKLLLNNFFVPNINTNNFKSALESYIFKMDELSNIQFHFNYLSQKYTELPQNIAKESYKIIIELITNALKHSKAENVWINIQLKRTELIIHIKDNGIGYNNNTIKKSFGLNSLKKRILLCNGHVDINTSKGTNYNISIPLKKR